MVAKNLEELRQEMDTIDNQLIQLLAKRQNCVVKAPQLHKKSKTVYVSKRSFKKFEKKANHYGVNPNLIEHLYREMIEIFITMELNEFKQKNSGE